MTTETYEEYSKRMIHAIGIELEIPERMLEFPVPDLDLSEDAQAILHNLQRFEAFRAAAWWPDFIFNQWLIEAHLSGALPLNFKTLNTKPEYTTLESALARAYLQSAYGKGAERHNGTGLVPFEDQPMQQIARMQGSVLGMEYQVHKKTREALGLPTHAAQVKELLGAIVYAAGMIVYLEAEEKIKHVAVDEPEDALGYEAANSQAAMPTSNLYLPSVTDFVDKMNEFRARFGTPAVRAFVRVSGVDKIVDASADARSKLFAAANEILLGAK